MASIGAAMAGAAWTGGQWPLTVVVMLFIAGAFVTVIHSPHIGISVFLTTFLINYPAVARGAGYFTINNALGAIFLGLLAWDYFVHRDAWYVREPLVQLLLLIGAVMLAGTVIAEYTLPDAYIQKMFVRRIGALRSAVDLTERQLFQYFSRVAFVVFVLQFVRTPRQLRMVFLTLLACILAAVPPALLHYASADVSAEGFRIRAPIVNWADNVNRFAFGCVLGMAFLFYLFTAARSMVVKISAALATVLLLPLVLLSASRSGFLGLGLLGALILRGTFGTREAGGSRAAAGAAVLTIFGLTVLTFFFVLTPRAQERVLNLNPFAAQRLEGSASAQQRAESVQESLALIRKYPIFGIGIGNFRWVNKYHHQSRWKPPHNSYLWAAVEGGVVLLALYLVLFWKLWRRLGRLRNAYVNRSYLQLFPHWLRVYMVLVLFFSFLADVWLEIHIFLLIAAAVLLEHWRQAPGQGRDLTPEHGSPDDGSGGGGQLMPAGGEPRPALVGAL
jgi:O-antigen ligase